MIALARKLTALGPELANCRTAVQDRYFHDGSTVTVEEFHANAKPVDLYGLKGQSVGIYVDGERVTIPFLNEDSLIEEFLDNSSKWERVGYLDNAVVYAVLASQKDPTSSAVQLRIESLRKTLGHHFAAVEQLIADHGPVSHLSDRLVEAMNARQPSASQLEFVGTLETLVALRPRETDYRLQLATRRFILRDFEGALNDYVIAMRGDLEPEALVEAIVGAGNACAELGRTDEACAYFRRALDAEPGSAYAWENLAICLVRSERAAEAVAALQDALKTDSQNPEYWFLYAAAHRALGDDAQVAKGTAMAVKLAPNEPKYIAPQALLDFEAKRYQEAIEHYSKALDAGADEGEMRFMRGRALVALGKHEAAIADFEVVKRLAGPRSPAATKALEIVRSLSK
jgi:tetratricopeptide (TPR) repeat protein